MEEEDTTEEEPVVTLGGIREELAMREVTTVEDMETMLPATAVKVMEVDTPGEVTVVEELPTLEDMEDMLAVVLRTQLVHHTPVEVIRTLVEALHIQLVRPIVEARPTARDLPRMFLGTLTMVAHRHLSATSLASSAASRVSSLVATAAVALRHISSAVAATVVVVAARTSTLSQATAAT